MAGNKNLVKLTKQQRKAEKAGKGGYPVRTGPLTVATSNKSSFGFAMPYRPLRMNNQAAGAAAQYARALVDPFDPQVVGVRVPEPFAVPTSTRHIRQTYSIVPVASNAYFKVLPHPCFAMVYRTDVCSVAGVTASGGSANNGFQTDNFGTLAGVANAGFVSPVTLQGLSGALSNWRVVAWGVRVRPSVTYTNASGRLFVANVPVAGEMPINGLLSAQTGVVPGVVGAMVVSQCVDPSGGTKGLLDMPRSMQAQLTELVEQGGYQISAPPAGPDFQKFRPAPYQYDGSNYNSYGVIDAVAAKSTNNSAGLLQGTQNAVTPPTIGNTLNILAIAAGSGSVDGWSAVDVAATGLPNATACLDVEVVYHLEGTPVVAAGVPVPVSASAGAAPDANFVPRAIAQATLAPLARAVKAVASDPHVQRAALSAGQRAMAVLGLPM